jgi:hypothetical protein
VDVGLSPGSTLQRYRVYPGLTANGAPTTSAADAINYRRVEPGDNYALIESWTEYYDGRL